MLHIKISNSVNFSMTVYKTDTVQKIKETIQEKGNIPIDEIVLTHKHKILKNDEILKDLKIDNNSNLNCHRSNCVIGGGGPFLGLDMAYIANKERLEKRMLYIKISGSVNFSMTVCKTDTVQKIKETIQEKGNIPIDEIVLTYNNKILKNDEILKDLKIKNNSNLNCHRSNSIIGGGSPLGLDMANIANKEGLEKRNFGKNAKKWNIITKGLNIEGVCNNSNCEAYNYKVDCQIGLGDFNLLENICKIKCPMCSKYIEHETCSFCKCQYQIEGTLSLSGETKDIEETKTEWIRVEKDYDYYDPIKSGKVRWFKLVIHTKDL